MKDPLHAAALVLLLLGGGPARAQETGEFGFRVPEGWTRVSPEMMNTSAENASPGIKAIVRKTHYVLMAIEPQGADAVCPANLSATLYPRPHHVTNRYLASLERHVLSQTQALGTDLRVLEHHIVEKDAVNVGALTSELSMGACRIRQVTYVIPGKKSTAQLTFSASAESFAGHRQPFETTALATTGVAEPSMAARLAGASSSTTLGIGTTCLASSSA